MENSHKSFIMKFFISSCLCFVFVLFIRSLVISHKTCEETQRRNLLEPRGVVRGFANEMPVASAEVTSHFYNIFHLIIQCFYYLY